MRFWELHWVGFGISRPASIRVRYPHQASDIYVEKEVHTVGGTKWKMGAALPIHGLRCPTIYLTYMVI